MKNIFKIHPLTYFFALLFILLGYFKFYVIFMSVIIIHEIGHIFFALLFKWKIKNIIFLPMGALIKFEDNLNKPIFEELIIAIMGIVFQSIYVIFFNSEIFMYCYKIILIFNIIPIYPLDGAKVINLLINKVTNFKTSYNISLIISYICVIVLVAIAIIKLSLFLMVAFIPLLIQIIFLINSRENIYVKFLLERYLYDIKFKKYKYIDSINKMKRDYGHYFIINDKAIEEKFILKRLFEQNRIIIN